MDREAQALIDHDDVFDIEDIIDMNVGRERVAYDGTHEDPETGDLWF